MRAKATWVSTSADARIQAGVSQSCCLKQSLKATLSLRPDLLSAEQKELLTGRLPYKMKKSERRFYEELRAEIAAEQEKRASAEVKEDEANG